MWMWRRRMYLILVPQKHSSGILYSEDVLTDDKSYKAFYSENIETVAGTMKQCSGCVVYKLDLLTEIIRIDVTMDEVTKETA